MRPATVVFIINAVERKVLLGIKGLKIGAGQRNGPGGKIELGEQPKKNAIRETREESGLRVSKLRYLGTVRCHNAKRFGDFRVRVYRTECYKGRLRSTKEFRDPRWFRFNRLPKNLMEGDRLWIHHVLRGRRFRGEIWYNEKQCVIKHNIKAM